MHSSNPWDSEPKAIKKGGNKMAGKERKDFCVECRDIKPYSLRKESITKTIRGKDYDFVITTAICEECGRR